jgi:hypothetical protein
MEQVAYTIVAMITVAIIKIVKAVSGTAAATSADHIVTLAIVEKVVMAMAAAYIVVTTPTKAAVMANAMTRELSSVAWMKLHIFIMSVTLTKLVAAMATAAKNVRTATVLPAPAKASVSRKNARNATSTATAKYAATTRI